VHGNVIGAEERHTLDIVVWICITCILFI